MFSKHRTKIRTKSDRRGVLNYFSSYCFNDITRDEIRNLLRQYDKMMDYLLGMQYSAFTVFLSLVVWHLSGKKLENFTNFVDSSKIVDTFCAHYEIKKNRLIGKEIAVAILFLNDFDDGTLKL